MTATTHQRRERILAQVYEKRHVAVPELAATLGVSEATVRRDLRDLADEGEIELVYGGATLKHRENAFSIRAKERLHVEAKRVIGRLAADLVGDDDQIFLDSGTTCFEMIPWLKRKRGLSVIVNSTRLAMAFDTPGLSVITVGGQYRPDRMDTVGPLAIATLDQLRGYLCFVGTDGLSMDFGLAAADIDSAHFNRRAVQHARETVLVADHSKFATPSLFKIVDWQAVRRIVTDQAPPPAWQEFLAKREIQVICPAEAATAGDVLAVSKAP